MSRLAFVISLFFWLYGPAQSAKKQAAGPVAQLTTRTQYVLVIHGGAGTILQSQMTPEREKAYRRALDSALYLGEEVLRTGGRAIDAVEVSVRSLEDNPLFNAGKGAVFTHDGTNELDAAIMDGKTLGAGSVAGVTTIRNPITAARAVMEKSPHVMMAGRGAEEFAAQQGLPVVDPSYFYTEERWQGLLEARREDSIESLSHGAGGNKDTAIHGIFDSTRHAGLLRQPGNHDYKYGTVGAVALDRDGNLAAATSTGGMTDKKFGRVGDAPIIGAGTYANNQSVAISCTGWGEFYIRLVMGKTISDMMLYGKMTLQQASREMVMKQLPALGGDGGLIAVDKNGNIAMPFNTAGMYRGFVREGGPRTVSIYKQANK